jgi:hypothetical protein
MNEAITASSNDGPKYLIVWCVGCITCSLSLFGSISIIYIARRKIYSNIYHRLLFTVSCVDVMSTVVGIFGPFLMNAKTGYKLSHGNQATCTFVGFITMFNVVSKAFYTLYIALYFMLSVRYNWTDAQVMRYEALAYVIAFIVPMSYGVAGFINEAFNPNEFRFCTIAKHPIGCVDDECTRGDIARKFIKVTIKSRQIIHF